MIMEDIEEYRVQWKIFKFTIMIDG